MTDKAQLESDLKSLHEKLSSVLAECNAKDDLVKKHTKIVQEAVEGKSMNLFFTCINSFRNLYSSKVLLFKFKGNFITLFLLIFLFSCYIYL